MRVLEEDPTEAGGRSYLEDATVMTYCQEKSTPGRTGPLRW